MRIAMELQPVLKNRSGIGWYTYNIIKAISKLDKSDEFVGCAFNFLGRHNIESIPDELNISMDVCKVIPYGVYSRLWDFIPFKYNNLFRTKADIYHFFNFTVPEKIDGKIIVTVYDMVYKRFPETMSKANFRRLEKNLQRSVEVADIIITISENSKKEIIKYLNANEDKIRIVHVGVDALSFRREYKNNEIDLIKRKYSLPDKYILYLGTLEPRKNIESIIESFALYKKYGGDLKLVIAGKKGWAYESIFRKVKNCSLENEVIFTGYIDEPDKPCIYKMSSLFLFPSLYEGFGIPVIEAMAAGVPVITSNASSLPEAAGDAAVLVDPRDIKSIANSMLTIIDNKEYRKELVLKGFEQIKRYTWERSAEELLNIYSELKESGL